MNVLYVNKVSPKFGGGAELRLLEIGKRLVARGHSVHVACGRTAPDLPRYESIEGIQVHYFGWLPKFAFRFRRLSFYLSRYAFYPLSIGLGNLVKTVSPDVVVDYASPAPSLVCLLAKRFDIPCCIEVMEYLGSDWFRLRRPVTALLGQMSQFILHAFRYDKMIAISDFTRCRLERAGFGSEDIAVVRCGVDLREFSATIPPKRIPNSLTVVGRLVPQKGHRFLIEALAHVKGEVPGVRLHIVGDGPLRNELEQCVFQGDLADNVDFHGYVTDEEKVELLRRSSIFVSPSLQEGFGIVLLEAMACGLPIVAFDLPVYHEFVDENSGILVPRMDSCALACGITRLLKNDQMRQRIGAFNLRRVARHFTWNESAKDAETTLRGVLAAHEQ